MTIVFIGILALLTFKNRGQLGSREVYNISKTHTIKTVLDVGFEIFLQRLFQKEICSKIYTSCHFHLAPLWPFWKDSLIIWWGRYQMHDSLSRDMVLWKDWGILDWQRHTVKPFEDRVVSFLFYPPGDELNVPPMEKWTLLNHQRGKSVGSPQ